MFSEMTDSDSKMMNYKTRSEALTADKFRLLKEWRLQIAGFADDDVSNLLKEYPVLPFDLSVLGFGQLSLTSCSVSNVATFSLAAV